MLSGRDDHGLLARPAVALQRSPTDLTVTGSAKDGVFGVVKQEQGSWLYVRTVEATPQEGWVNDFYARGEAVLTERTVRVRFRDAIFKDGQVLVLVASDRGEEWQPASGLREVGAR
jgi:hypothetical protein